MVNVAAQTEDLSMQGTETAVSESDSTAEPLRFDKGHFLTFRLGGGIGRMKYMLTGGRTDPFKFSATGNIDYSYFFLPWLGVGTGIDLSYYASESELTKRMIWSHTDYAQLVDYQGESYDHRVDFVNWTERENLLMLEVPIALKFKVKPRKVGGYFDAGIKLAFPVFANYNHPTGDLIHSAYYEQWDVELSSLPGRYETETLERGVEGKVSSLSKINAEAFADLGMLFELDRTTDLTLGIYVDYTINNANSLKEPEALGFACAAYGTDHFMNTYKGLFATDHIGAIHPWAFGLKLGLQTHILTKADKERLRDEQRTAELNQIAEMRPDTIFVHDTLYMYVHDTVVGGKLLQDTLYLIRTDTICPENQYSAVYPAKGSSADGRSSDGSNQLSGSDGVSGRDGDPRYSDYVGYPPAVVVPVSAGSSGSSGSVGSSGSSGSVGSSGSSRKGDYSYVMDEQSKSEALDLDVTLERSVIWFHFDDYKPILEPFDVIEAVSKVLKQNPQLRVNINGHACKIGTDSYNQRLAMLRAQAVARLLKLKGVPEEQFTVRSLGANEPYRYNSGKHQYSKDRRVEIVPVGIVENVHDMNAATAYNDQTNTAPLRARTDIDYWQYDKFLGEEKVREGSRLAQIARRWYDNPYFWVYIFEANADKIENPNQIEPGLTVMIPDLTEINKGLTAEQATERARDLEQIYGYAVDEDNLE